MATISRIAKKSVKKSIRKHPSEKSLNLSLPDKPDIPPNSFSSYVTLIYGKKKIGKTSLLANLSDKSFTLAFENVSKSLTIMKKPIPDWEYMVGYCKLLMNEPDKYDMITVDSLPKAYDISLEYACKKYGISHPGEMNDYGASWNKVEKVFLKELNLLFSLSSGVAFTAHEKIESIDKRDGGKFNVVIPEYGSACKKFVDTEVDNVFNYQMRGNNRFLQIRGDDYVLANCCHEENFLTPEGEHIMAIPMGDSPKQAVENLLNAFDNKQTETYSDYRKEPVKQKIKKQATKRVLKRK